MDPFINPSQEISYALHGSLLIFLLFWGHMLEEGLLKFNKIDENSNTEAIHWGTNLCNNLLRRFKNVDKSVNVYFL